MSICRKDQDENFFRIHLLVQEHCQVHLSSSMFPLSPLVIVFVIVFFVWYGYRVKMKMKTVMWREMLFVLTSSSNPIGSSPPPCTSASPIPRSPSIISLKIAVTISTTIFSPTLKVDELWHSGTKIIFMRQLGISKSNLNLKQTNKQTGSNRHGQRWTLLVDKTWSEWRSTSPTIKRSWWVDLHSPWRQRFLPCSLPVEIYKIAIKVKYVICCLKVNSFHHLQCQFLTGVYLLHDHQSPSSLSSSAQVLV